MEERTIDDVINTVGSRPNCAMFALTTWAMACSMVGSLCAYMVQFTGFVPTGPITCLSDNCTFLQSQDLLNVTTICDEGLVYGVDYTWNISRTTLAVEWDLICHQSKITFLNSVYFIGALISLIIGSYLYDAIGRRQTCIIAGTVCLVGNFLGVVCHSYYYMIAIRLSLGFGNFLAYSGCYIWVLEFMPGKFRNYYNSYSMLIWAIGYIILVGISYFIHNWNFIHLGCGIVFLICFLPFTFYPDSPRYLLSVGKEEEAKKVLERYGRLTNTPVSLKDVKLIGSENTKQDSRISFRSKMREYGNHPGMLVELGIQCYLWFVCCLLFYGLNYGWSSFAATPYESYLFAGVSEVIAYILLFIFIKFFGRKKTLYSSLFASTVCFLLANISWTWTDTWNLERLMSLVVTIWISLAFALLFLYVGELAPTYLRGFTLSICSFIARIAAFCGPYLAGTSGTVKLTGAAAMAALGGALVFLLPETRCMPIPAEAADVSERRQQQSLRISRARYANEKDHTGEL